MTAAADYILMRRDLAAPVPETIWPDGVRVMPCDSSDAPACHALLQNAYASGYGSVPDDWLAWFEAVWGDSEFDPDLCLVAKAGGEVAGFCLCWTSTFIKDLAVAPQWQRQGVGRALLLTAMAKLRARGDAEVSLKVKVENAVARRMYEGLGFVG